MGASPEEDLLLQMQGMFAEYERAKIMERSRRGKRHAAQRGSVNVLSAAPFGYRYITKQEGNGTAAYEFIEEQAAVVRQVFEWVGCDRLSIGAVSRRLKERGIKTATGKAWWDRATVWGMLKNTAYMGSAAFGKTRTGKRRKRPMPQRGHSKTPRRTGSTYDTAKEEWLLIPVPSIVDEALFETVQEQLDANRQQASERKRGARYLLQGIVKCSCCGYAYYGKKVSRSSAKGRSQWAYYRCIGTDAYRFGGKRVCENKQVRTDKLDEAVWNDVCELLRNPDLLREEYECRLKSSGKPSSQRKSLMKQIEQSRKTVSRLIDAYSDGVISREEFNPRIERARAQLKQREESLAQARVEDAEREALQESLQCLESFTSQIAGGLDNADWNTRREILRTAIDHVQVEPEHIRINYRINFPLFLNRKGNSKSLLFRWRRDDSALRRSDRGGLENSVFEHTCCQKLLNEIQDIAVGHFFGHSVDDQFVRDVIEKAGDVRIESDAVSVFVVRQHSLNRHLTTATGSEPERAIVKHWLEDRLQEGAHNLLSNSISHSRNAQRA